MLKKRIPTVIGLILLIIGAVAGTLLLNKNTDFLPRASPEYIPQKINITNVSDTGFVVSWLTQEPTIGFIKLGPTAGNLDTTVVDERDQLTGNSGEFRTHYIVVTGMQPATAYFFKLGSHGKKLYDNNGQALTITTGPTLSAAPPANTAYGTVMTPAQTPAEGALLYLSFPDTTNAAPLSALVKQNGNWAMSLSTARLKDLTAYVEIPPTVIFNILARSNFTDDATAIVPATGVQPVPPIILGQSHDFRTISPAVSPATTAATPTPVSESKFSLTPITVTDLPGETTLTIDTPIKDASVVSNQPKIQGKAPPGMALTITVHSDSIYTGSVNVDETGRWLWTPTGYLEPGEHTLSVSYTDTKGLLHTLSRTFVVSPVQASNGNLPGYTATPSATLTPTRQPTPTLIPSPVPTVIPTRQPTPTPTLPVVISPTIRPTLVLTPTPLPAITRLPRAGTVAPTLTLLFIGLLMAGWGFILLKNPAR